LLSKFKKNKKVQNGNDPEGSQMDFETYLAQKNNTKLVVDGKNIRQFQYHLFKPIFEKDLLEFKRQLELLKGQQSEYEWAISVCFWFSVHIKNLEIVRYIVEIDRRIRKLAYFALISKTKDSSDESSQSDNHNKNKKDLYGSDEEDAKAPENESKRNSFQNVEEERNLPDSDEDEKEWNEGGEGDEEDKEKVDYQTNTLQKSRSKKTMSLKGKIDTIESGQPVRRSQDTKTDKNSKMNTVGNRNSEDADKKFKELDENKDNEEDVEIEQEDKASKKSHSFSIHGERKADSEHSTYGLKTSGFNFKTINEEEVNQLVVDNIQTLDKIRYYLQTGAPVFMGNILMLLVRAGEQLLSCILIKFYKICISEDHIKKVIAKDQYMVLKYLWKMNKNYVEIPDSDESQMFTYVDLLNEFKHARIKGDKDSDDYIRIL